MNQNRRRFSRIPFQTEARLFLSDGDIEVEVLDLSLQGALIHPKAALYVTVGTHGTLKIRLDEQGTSIRMEVAVVHHMASYYGLACREIDLDSVTHLRRLVALNLGDETLAGREIAQLAHSWAGSPGRTQPEQTVAGLVPGARYLQRLGKRAFRVPGSDAKWRGRHPAQPNHPARPPARVR